MGLITESDVQKLMQNEDLMSDVVKALIEDPEALDSLAGDIADELEDELEDSPEFRKQIIDVAVSSPEFKKRIVTKLVAEIG